MKRIFVFFIQWLILNNIQAQTLAEDFTLIDVNGKVYHLYSELNAGKTVVLNFFITLCSTCQTSAPMLEEIWQNRGYDGDSLWIWGIEASGRHDSDIVSFMTQFGITYPCFSTSNDDVVLYVYNVTYTPQYYVICPNKLFKRVDITQLDSAIDACNETLYIEHLFLEHLIYNQNQIILPFNEPAFIQIFDIFGKTVCSKKNVIGYFDVPFLKAGTYIFYAESANKCMRKVIIKY